MCNIWVYCSSLMSLNGIPPWYDVAAACDGMFCLEASGSANRCFLQCKKTKIVVNIQSALISVSHSFIPMCRSLTIRKQPREHQQLVLRNMY
jgi:hypothetical protein